MIGRSARRLLRTLVLMPPVLLALGGLLQAARTPFDFSGRIAENGSTAMWVITVDVLLLAVPFLIAGVGGTLKVWQTTRRLFRVDSISVAIGLFGIVPTIFILFLLRQDVESSFSYTMIFSGGLTSAGSLAVTVIAAAAWSGITTAFLSIYLVGIVSEGSGKYDKRLDETDGVGRLLDERLNSTAG